MRAAKRENTAFISIKATSGCRSHNPLSKASETPRTSRPRRLRAPASQLNAKPPFFRNPGHGETGHWLLLRAERWRNRRPQGVRLRGRLRRGEGPRRRRRRRGRRGRLYLRGGAILGPRLRDEAGRDKSPSPGSPARRNISLANGVSDDESCRHSSETCRSRPRADPVGRAAAPRTCLSGQSHSQAPRRRPHLLGSWRLPDDARAAT